MKNTDENVLFKVIIMGFLILVLMIPSIMINELVRERSSRKWQVTQEVSSKWGQLQTITGPYIVIPYLEEIKHQNQASEWREQNLYYFPQQLETTGSISRSLRRGAFSK
jgi:inner membrane protein